MPRKVGAKQINFVPTEEVAEILSRVSNKTEYINRAVQFMAEADSEPESSVRVTTFRCPGCCACLGMDT